MRKIIVAAVVAFVFGAFAVGISTSNAEEQTIADRFGPNENLVAAETGVYEFDQAHTSIGFKVIHMGLINVPGYFNDFTGKINYNAEDVSKSTVEFSAKTTSVDTRVERRDNHLRSDDFFDVEKHPEMSFKSTSVTSKDGMLAVTGDFTLRGVTKSITIPVKIAGFKARGESTTMGAMAETTIKRSEYGVNYGIENGIATGAVSDEVKIELNIEARSVKKAE